MNRRHFMGGVLAVLGAGAFNAAVSPAVADTPAAPSVPDCLFPPELLDRAEALIIRIRSQLRAASLLETPATIVDFYNSVVNEYERTFGADGVNWDELDEAGYILDDPNCYVAVAPETGCDYYEAWKFFLHQEGLALYPADGSVPFRALMPADQIKVAEATTAYVGMLQTLFSSLMTEKGMNTEAFNGMNADLFVYGASMNEIRIAAIACGVPSPDPSVTPADRPAPVIALAPAIA